MKLRIAAMLLSAAMFMVSCGKGKESAEAYVPDYHMPKVVCGDGSEITLPAGGYELKSVPEAAEVFFEEAGIETTLEALNGYRFSENIIGAGEAAVFYFSKKAEKLTDDEWKKLADIAISDDKELPSEAAQYSRIPDSAYFDAMTEEIVRDMVKQKGIDRDEAFRMLYSEGVRIESPYLPEVQKIVDDVYSDASAFSKNGGGFPQSACAVLDNSGSAVALAGGNNGNNAYNRAYRSLLNIGSTVKPLAVYAPALRKGIINFSSIVSDQPVMIGSDGEPYPNNYNGIFEGDVTVTYALRQSKNTVPVRLSEEMKTSACADVLKKEFHFDTLTYKDNTLQTTVMGCFDQGVPLTRLAAAYCIFANGGNYCEPVLYTRVTDSSGNIIAESVPAREKILTEAQAWIMNRLLYYNVEKEDGIAGAAKLSNGCEAAGKTGTVNNSAGQDTEKLFVGSTPQYTAAVWVGMDDKTSDISMYDYVSPAGIWNRIISSINGSEKSFHPAEDVVEYEYCKASGGIAGEKCSVKEKGWYTPDNIPEKCDIHK